jgi:hypothetical protein
VVLEPHRVGKRVERERVLCSAVDAEEVDLRPEREHEVVVGLRLELLEPRLARVEVHLHDPVLVDPRVVVALEEVADRVADRRLFQQTRSELVEQRLERVVVVLVDEDDVDGALREFVGGTDPAEAAAQDEDARTGAVGRGAEGAHGASR